MDILAMIIKLYKYYMQELINFIIKVFVLLIVVGFVSIYVWIIQYRKEMKKLSDNCWDGLSYEEIEESLKK